MKIHFIQIIIISIIISYLFNMFTGIHHTVDYFSNLWFPFADTLFTFLLIIILSSNKYLFWIVLVPYSLLVFLYAPTGIKFGFIDFYYLYSLLATNTAESLEFLKSISLLTWFLSFSFLVLLFINRHLIKQYNYSNTKKIIIFCLVSIIWFSYKMIINPELPSPTIVKTPKEVISNSLKLYQDISMLRLLESEESNWVVDSVDAEYKNYILIIGESQRRDYMNCYGFPYENTPFMSSNGTVLEGLTSAGFNTISSLRYMLTNTPITEEKPNYKGNFIDLANKADFETIWISNQGVIGEYDTPIAFVAKRSSKNIFLKTGKYDIFNFDDFEMIPKFEKEFQKPSHKNRLFVIHLMGSHPNAEERIINYPKMVDFPENKEIEDYVNSIHKTDSLVKMVYEIAEKEYNNNDKETFSLIYFADHGLKHYSKGETNISGDKVSQAGFFVNSDIKEVYEIPLFKISSDDFLKKHIQVEKYGKNFTRGLANWMGIKSPQIKVENDLFSLENDTEIDKSLQLEKKRSMPFSSLKK